MCVCVCIWRLAKSNILNLKSCHYHIPCNQTNTQPELRAYLTAVYVTNLSTAKPPTTCISIPNRWVSRDETHKFWVSHITLVIAGLWILSLNNVLMHVECQCLQRRQGERGEGREGVALADSSTGVDVHQFRSRWLARVIHSSFSFPLTGPELCLFSAVFTAGGICLCHTDVNVYTRWTLAGLFFIFLFFYSPKKMCTVSERAEIV